MVGTAVPTRLDASDFVLNYGMNIPRRRGRRGPRAAPGAGAARLNVGVKYSVQMSTPPLKHVRKKYQYRYGLSIYFVRDLCLPFSLFIKLTGISVRMATAGQDLLHRDQRKLHTFCSPAKSYDHIFSPAVEARSCVCGRVGARAARRASVSMRDR